MTLLRSGIPIVSIILIIFSLTIMIMMMATPSISIEKSGITIQNHYAYASPTSPPTPYPTTAVTAVTLADFNFAAVGDWGCTSDTIDTVKNIEDKNPELVLALGDLSYNSTAKCWLDIIEPIADKTMIAIGNHEIDSTKKLEDYMDYFGLKEQYYSFNYENVHFTVISTEQNFHMKMVPSSITL